jgi:anti-sigma-K factor RskA
MWDDLPGYLLNALDEHDREAMERFLQANVDAATAVELLKQRFAWLESAREEQPPPAELAARTCQYVRIAVEKTSVARSAGAVEQHTGQHREQRRDA